MVASSSVVTVIRYFLDLRSWCKYYAVVWYQLELVITSAILSHQILHYKRIRIRQEGRHKKIFLICFAVWLKKKICDSNVHSFKNYNVYWSVPDVALSPSSPLFHHVFAFCVYLTELRAWDFIGFFSLPISHFPNTLFKLSKCLK